MRLLGVREDCSSKDTVGFGHAGQLFILAVITVKKHISFEEGVSSEEFVGPLPGNDDFESALAHTPAHVPLGNAECVVEGSLGVPGHFGEVVTV